MLVVSAGLRTTVFPHASAGASFHAAISNGKFHGNDLSRDAERPRFPPGKSVFEFVRPTGVIKKMRGHQRQIDVAAFLDGFAAIHRFDHGEFARFLLNDAGDAIEIFAAFASGHIAPDFFVSAPRRFHRWIDIRPIRRRDLRQFFFRGRIDRIEIFARIRRDEFPINEQLIFGREFDVAVLSGAGA